MNNYILTFRIAFPQKDKYAQMDEMTIKIPAIDKTDAKEKLKKFVLTKISVSVIDAQNENEYKPKRFHKQYNEKNKNVDFLNDIFGFK